MLIVMVDRVCGRHEILCMSHVQAGIQIPVKPREIAAADLEPQDVPLAKNIACGPEVEVKFVDLTRVHQFRFLLRIPVACANDSFSQVLSDTVWPDIHEFACEVGIYRGRLGIQLNADGTRDLHVPV